MDAIALAVDELLHLRVPPLFLVAEVNACFEKLAHSKLWKSHGRFLSGFNSLGRRYQTATFLKKAKVQPVDGSGFLPDAPAPVWGFRVARIERGITQRKCIRDRTCVFWRKDRIWARYIANCSDPSAAGALERALNTTLLRPPLLVA